MSPMPSFKSWTLTHVPDRSRDPIANRRSKMVERLQEQRALAEDANYIRKKNRWTGKGTERRRIEVEQKVRPWWRTSPEGGLVFSLYVGARPIEISKGLAGVKCNEKTLVATIDQAVDYVTSGALDGAITVAASKVTFKPKKRAA
jgi:hypothetical protein